MFWSCASTRNSKRQEGLPAEILQIALKAQNRLHKRYMKLMAQGKEQRKTMTAIARELLRKWQTDGLDVVPVAVNVSAIQFRQNGFSEEVREVLNKTGLPPRFLELELTESVLLSNAHVTCSVLNELLGMGVKLAIDDFGTGYSNLSYLKRFSANRLKIDRSFIRDLAVDSDDAAIIVAIIGMAKALHLTVVAEGVETEQQMSFLRNHDCNEIQGFLFSEPLSASDMTQLLKIQAGQHPIVIANSTL